VPAQDGMGTSPIDQQRSSRTEQHTAVNEGEVQDLKAEIEDMKATA